MLLEEASIEQLEAAMEAGLEDEIMAYLEQEGIELPEKAPWGLPDDIAEYGMKIWRMFNVEPREFCAEGGHDFQPTGKCEMARNEATLPGSCFRTEYECTKCGMMMWKTEKEPEPVAEEAAEEAAEEVAE